MNVRTTGVWLALPALLTLAGWLSAQPAGPNIDRLREGLRSKRADTRLEAARALGKLGARARPAVPDLTRLLIDEKDVNVYEKAATALARIGELDALRRQVQAQQVLIDLYNERIPKLEKDVRDLNRLAADAARMKMFTSHAMFTARAREGRELIGKFLQERADARRKQAVVQALLRTSR